MKKRIVVICIAALILFSLTGLVSFSQQKNSGSSTGAMNSETYGQLPLSFEKNQGQVGEQVQFLSRGAGYSLHLSGTKATLALTNHRSDGLQNTDFVTLSMELVLILRSVAWLDGAGLCSHRQGYNRRRQSGPGRFWAGWRIYCDREMNAGPCFVVNR